MPAQRLPWFKFWIGATSHGKVRTLDDGTFRTWVELLDAAAQQPKRGRFANRAEAVAITRRPAKHIAMLITSSLIDETPEGLVMHDWDDWQRWRKEDLHDYETPTDQPPNGPGIGSRTTTERPTHQRTNNSLPLNKKEKEIKDVDVDRELEREDIPSLRSGGTARRNGAPPRGNPKVQAVKDAFRELGLEPAMSGRDYAAVKQSTAPPALIAETYLAVADREYGDDFMRKRLSVHEAVDWVNGYCEQRLNTVWSRDEELDRLHELGYNPISTAKGA